VVAPRRAALLVALLATPAGADPVHKLRLATAAPDGTAWAREFRAFARDVELVTHGEVLVKWYFGGIAGDELEVGERIRRDQLDGAASAGVLCERLSPTMRITRVPGVFHSREEEVHVFSRLTPALTEDFHRAGFAYLGGPSLGPELLFSREKVTTLDEMRHTKLWRWDVDEIALTVSREMRMQPVPTSLPDALPSYEARKLDGFVIIPTGALAFQWSTNTHYVLRMPFTWIMGCLLVSNRAFDAIPTEHQKAIRAAAAKAIARVSEVGRLTDEQLIGELFARQGNQMVDPSPELTSSYLAATHEALRSLGERLVPAAVLKEVQGYLDEFRAAQH
jgi:TRAP-type C4-dicarboxylate transport system substrate-binding protein